MVCFLACFGFSNKRRRRKPSFNVISGDKKHGSYEPLDSSVSLNLDITEDPIGPCSEFRVRDKPKERPSLKVRKKVRFNLNVQTYEPVPTDYNLSESDEEQEKIKKWEETEEGGLLPMFSKVGRTEWTMGSYPTNYRYQNCSDSYDEENDFAYEEIDLDDDDDINDYDDIDDNSDGGDEECYGGNEILHERGQEEVSWQLESSYMESQKFVSSVQLTKDQSTNIMPTCASNVRELKPPGLHQNARDRSQYVHSVLNPIENITQWKAVKARAAAPERQRKENIESMKNPTLPFTLKPIVDPRSFSHPSQSNPLMQEIAVDASLSNWLPKSNRSEITTHCS
ncbi:uncharacterized protein LOC122276525 [Carya illinoinensis]|uniref:Uncharacterized protein n=1 Tax=Carya illinoinensis TaxID=32201 RepID=A0A8T1RNX3_CARIL|nr:uncharacterized protein LOC122276525 [Carya illinoinensis]KAG6668564.1 hypothetical protein CIPAW_01G179500 [Carya illinoinensis]